MTSPDSTTEHKLVRAAANGDRSAMKAIYDLHCRYLAAVVGRYMDNDEDAKDVLQEAFVKIFSSLAGYEHRGEGSLRRWMARIAANEALTILRRARPMELTPLTEATEMPSEMNSDASASDIYAAIKDLPAGYRAVFNLFAIEGYSHKEIASMLGIRESTSASQYHRARSLLARRLSSLNPDKRPHYERREMAR
ncbi:MAG: sigma-70 family RNA polymerase sigma factor [Pseudoflavonifractor sp.]|nr:sigma-70 family RNA polymerase sigma factor [Alloprevotella sp.]MCM1116479.1 sigma-70 family RNA polymerase sigma factor [Pseudoflavonifractor sp.]